MRIIQLAASFVLFAALGFGPAPASAQERPDRQAVEHAIVLSDFGLRAARVAQDRAETGQVREYAQDVADRFRTLGNDVRDAIEDENLIRQANNVELDREHRDMLAQLEKAKGAEFDRLFLEAQHHLLTAMRPDLEAFAAASRNQRNQQAFKDALKVLSDNWVIAERLRNNLARN
jgi:predicted outer membrane protein